MYQADGRHKPKSSPGLDIAPTDVTRDKAGESRGVIQRAEILIP
jgi:hypothetical protein